MICKKNLRFGQYKIYVSLVLPLFCDITAKNEFTLCHLNGINTTSINNLDI